jgi:hypothetical protein
LAPSSGTLLRSLDCAPLTLSALPLHAQVSFPPEAKARFPGGFDVALANFGEPLYGGALQGRLVYADPSAGVAAACAPECRFACSDLGAATPPLDLRRLPGAVPGVPPILLVDRGPPGAAGGAAACKFAEKVWNAQRAGAAGVVVANYEDALTTMEAPDDDDEVRARPLPRPNRRERKIHTQIQTNQ